LNGDRRSAGYTGPRGKTEVSMCKKGAGKPHTRTYVGTWKW